MSLPSKYAPEGLSSRDQAKTITSGTRARASPQDYIVRRIETRINQAIESSHHADDDIEMVPTDDYNEVDVISQFVARSRTHTDNLENNWVPPSNQPELTYTPNSSFLVVDTNFVLSHLNILDDLKNLNKQYNLQIIVPSTVMQELDGLKKSSRYSDKEGDLSQQSVSHLARWANDWIFAELADNSTAVRGQKLGERIDRFATQDDAILDCCMYFKSKYHDVLVVLLSNDKNFCMKALTNDILTVSYRKGMTALLIGEMIYNESILRFGDREDTMEFQPAGSTSPPPPPPQHKPAADADVLYETAARTVQLEVQTIALSAIHKCMESVYGEDIELLHDYDKDRVASLMDCGEIIIRFWFPVFQEYFKRSPSHFVPFEENGKRKVPAYTSINPGEFQSFVDFWTSFLVTIYRAEMDQRQNASLSVLVERWNGFASLFPFPGR